MGCNNSHLRPFFRRCRRKKDDANCTPKRQANDSLIDSNHVDANTSNELHGFQFLGSSIRQSKNAVEINTSSDQPSCVPLLAQSELSHSQLEFFRMLDDKIQQGPDYDSEEDKEETKLLIKKNLAVWRDSIASGKKSTACSSSKISGNTIKSRCQWEDEGDGG